MRRHMNSHMELNAGFVFNFKKGLEIKDAGRFRCCYIRLLEALKSSFSSRHPASLELFWTRIVMGNIAHQSFICSQTCEALVDQELTTVTIARACQVLGEELRQAPTVVSPRFVVAEAAHGLALAPALRQGGAQGGAVPGPRAQRGAEERGGGDGEKGKPGKADAWRGDRDPYGMMDYVVWICLYISILYCIMLSYIISYYIILYYLILYYIITYYIILYIFHSTPYYDI